jgi:hypothetical protein
MNTVTRLVRYDADGNETAYHELPAKYVFPTSKSGEVSVSVGQCPLAILAEALDHGLDQKITDKSNTGLEKIAGRDAKNAALLEWINRVCYLGEWLSYSRVKTTTPQTWDEFRLDRATKYAISMVTLPTGKNAKPTKLVQHMRHHYKALGLDPDSEGTRAKLVAVYMIDDDMRVRDEKDWADKADKPGLEAKLIAMAKAAGIMPGNV